MTMIDDIRPQQIHLLEDAQGVTLQTRFEQFCNEAIDRLTQTYPKSGDPVFPAGKAKSRMQVTVEIERAADDALSFSIVPEIKEKHPAIPGKAKSSVVVMGLGLSQRVTTDQPALFNPAEGQPQPLSIVEARRVLARDASERELIDAE